MKIRAKKSPSHKWYSFNYQWLYLIVSITLIAGIVILYFLLFLLYKETVKMNNYDFGIYHEDYQAVFVSNGQVYFGKITNNNKQTLTLEAIYYLQVNNKLQPVEKDNKSVNKEPKLSLIKLGNELHGPTDRMVINKDHILFIEDLKPDSLVVKSIKSK